MEEERVDPDALLRAISASEKINQKGRLKIFLGMAAGVGKTYAMLEEARERAKQGVFLIVGSIYTHGREETARLLEGLEIIPEKSIQYRGKEFKELDLDEILKRKPELVLVDELAHTNIPGSRHLKRWQDVIEILEAGIDVYTTLNIQHLESRKEIVENIAEIKIQETVPDLIIEMASEVKLVDFTPSGLLVRLKEGKVYVGDLGEIAAKSFFQEDRLTALRELSLRFTAEKVDHELHSMVSTVQKGKEWKASDRLLVAISKNPSSENLIRTARRLAFNLDAPWIALYVDQGEDLIEEEKSSLTRNMNLARELGAEVIATASADIAEGIERIAAQKEVTLIVIGKSLKRSLKSYFFPSMSLERQIADRSDIDVYIAKGPFLGSFKEAKLKKPLFTAGIKPYLLSFGWVATLTVLNALIIGFIDYKIAGFIYLFGIVVLSLFTKIGPLISATFASAIAWVLFFIPFAPQVHRPTEEDSALIALFFVLALILGILTNRAKVNRDLLIKREQSTATLYDIVREIASAPSGEIFEGVRKKIEAVLNGTAEIIIQKNNGDLAFYSNSLIASDEKEKGVAYWAYKSGKEAGWSTTTLPLAKNIYFPLKGFKTSVGVLAFKPVEERSLLPEEMNFLSTVAGQLGHYFERKVSEEKDRKALYFGQIEKIYEKVLHLLADELKKPLALIQEAVSSCKGERAISEDTKLNASFLKVARSLSSLFRITENASNMAKLSSGLIKFQKAPHEVKDLIDICSKKAETHLKQHHLEVNLQRDIGKVSFDFALLEVLLNNFLSNAIEYTPPDTKITIEAEVIDKTFVLSVSDEGPGIPEDMMDLVFEKFYRIPGTKSTGLGLGLAIAKSIAELHSGFIKAQNNVPKGAKFSLLIPIS